MSQPTDPVLALLLLLPFMIILFGKYFKIFILILRTHTSELFSLKYLTQSCAEMAQRAAE
jgi:hypothetical protein